MKDKITTQDCVQLYKIDLHFIEALEDSGLITPYIENNVKYIIYDDLGALEKFANWHYDLDINIAGLEVIHHLLKKIDHLQNLNQRLSVGFKSFEE
ncbi:chaperone modulator CbpM [Riemerella columbina]|uniref:chaperone modulator CbpM n=1 Tax=Riemerella columbina TaxID=103810 RepID=UPI00036995DA|nr:chaperone modulator CbpM [Riemerella columbina]